MNFGNRIKNERLKRNMSLRDVEVKTGITNTALRRYEKGQKGIEIQSLINLCLLYDVSADYLLGMKP